MSDSKLDRIESGITNILTELESLRQRVAALEEQNAEQQAQILALFQRFPPPQNYADYKTINDLTEIEDGSISDDYKWAFASPTQDFSLALSDLKENIRSDFDAVYAAINGSSSQPFECADPQSGSGTLNRSFADNRYPRRTQDSNITSVYTFDESPIVPDAQGENEAVNLGQLNNSQTIVVFSFEVNAGNIVNITNLPNGWEINRVSEGIYNVTHDLGYPLIGQTGVGVVNRAYLGSGYFSHDDSPNINTTFQAGVWNASDGNFDPDDIIVVIVNTSNVFSNQKNNKHKAP